jgi:acyl-CoA synthetase (NDP forming)
VIFDAAIKQAGLIRAKDLDEFLDLIKTFEYLSLPKGNRVGITSCSGGAGAMAADACEDYGLKLADLSENTNRRVAELSSSIKVSNLIDLFAFGAPKEPSLLLHEGVIKALMLDANVDSILMCLLTAKQAWLPDLQTSSITKIEQVKPIAAWVTGVEKTVMKITEFLEEGGIPVFPSPERAVRALGGLYKYYQQVTKDT